MATTSKNEFARAQAQTLRTVKWIWTLFPLFFQHIVQWLKYGPCLVLVYSYKAELAMAMAPPKNILRERRGQLVIGVVDDSYATAAESRSQHKTVCPKKIST